ncbi:MAG: CBS domain-containing protein [Candidatus Bathyarchaeia archaeon]
MAGKIVNMRSELYVDPDANISDIAKRMQATDSEALFVVNGSKPVGIIRSVDLIEKVLARDQNPRKLRAKDVMRTPAPCVPANAGLRAIVPIMNVARTTRVLVTDGDKIIGAVTAGALLNVVSTVFDDIELYRALSTRVRVEILELLSIQPGNVDQVAAMVGQSPVTVRRHLEVLKRAGIVEESEGRYGRPGRPSITYRIAQKIFRKEASQPTSAIRAQHGSLL